MNPNLPLAVSKSLVLSFAVLGAACGGAPDDIVGDEGVTALEQHELRDEAAGRPPSGRPQADLIVQRLQVVVTEQALEIGVRVCNLGDVTAGPSTTQVILASDGVASRRGRALHALAHGRVGARSCEANVFRAGLPPTGRYEVQAFADARGEVAESDEANNAARQPLSVQPAPRPTSPPQRP